MAKVLLKDIAGFKIGAVKAGIKKSGNLDLGLIASDELCSAAGVFTTNKVCAAPVKVSRKHLEKSSGHAKAIMVNAGNANACTGAQGRKAASDSAALVAKLCGCKREEVLLCSTGIIGVQLPMDKISSGVEKVYESARSGKTAKLFSRAIMTTDTVHKERGIEIKIGGKPVRIAAAAKGVGMLAPNMATMLAFTLTDADIAPRALQSILSEVVKTTFNRVTVDGDTSTNDTCLIMASGKAGNKKITSAKSAEGRAFASALREVAYALARDIAADGEGATTMIQVLVKGAKSESDAERAARTIAESPLVKTAVAGNDPNWGRIMMALGRSGAKVNESKTRVEISGSVLFEKGAPVNFSAKKISALMKKKEVTILVEMGVGRAEAEVLTCDLTHGYITINADYHT